MKTLQTFGLSQTPTQSAGTVTAPSQQTSITDMSNIRYPRVFILNNGFITVSHSTVTAGIALHDLVLALVTLEPSLTYPPVVAPNGQPQPQTVTAPAPATFQFVVTSEVPVGYVWEVSTDGGNTWNPTVDGMGGPYTGSATFQLSISNTTGLNNNQYRCTASNVSGAITSNAALLKS